VFGYDEAELERLRRGPRRLRPSVVLLQALFALCVAAPVTLLDVVNDPRQVEGWVNRLAGRAEFRIGIEEIEWLPVSTVWHPFSWRFAVTGLSFDALDPKKPDWRAERATVVVPEPLRVKGEGGWVLRTPLLRVSGLAIDAHQQRPPPPWEPKTPWIRQIQAEVVEIWDASFHAPEDPPIGAAAALGIRGRIAELAFDPGQREVSGQGELWLSSFTTGDITVTQGHLTKFELDRSTLRLGGSFQFAGARGEVDGEIRTFHVRSEVALHAQIAGASLHEVIETATGDPSALDGNLDLDLTVEAGGDRPRGASRLVGSVKLRDGFLQLGRDTRHLVLDVLDVLPWIDLNAKNQVQLRPLHGEIELNRGTVIAKDWSYPVGKRDLRVDGTIADGDLWLFVRLLPPRGVEDYAERTGAGLLIWGSSDAQRFKLASREDLTRSDPWNKKVPDAPEPPERPAKQGGGGLFSRRAPEADPPASAPSPSGPPTPSAVTPPKRGARDR
jgi:hypothetical protein